jgi:hypothetical protein
MKMEENMTTFSIPFHDHETISIKIIIIPNKPIQISAHTNTPQGGLVTMKQLQYHAVWILRLRISSSRLEKYLCPSNLTTISLAGSEACSHLLWPRSALIHQYLPLTFHAGSAAAGWEGWV